MDSAGKFPRWAYEDDGPFEPNQGLKDAGFTGGDYGVEPILDWLVQRMAEHEASLLARTQWQQLQTTWAEDSNGFARSLLGIIKHSDGKWVAIGNNSGGTEFMLTSRDLITWDLETVSTIGGGIDYNALIEFNDGLIYAVGDDDGGDAHIVRFDPEVPGVWTEMSNPKALNLFDIYANDTTMIAVGQEDGDGYILRSTDGTTWTEIANPDNLDLRSVYYDDGIWMAVGQGSYLIVSDDDGLTWTERTIPGTSTLRGIVRGQGLWVVVGNRQGGDGAIYTSTDTYTWTEQPNPRNEHLYDVCHTGGGLFLAVGADDPVDGYVLMSANGVNWIELSNPSANSLFSIACEDGVVVAVGQDQGPEAYVVHSMPVIQPEGIYRLPPRINGSSTTIQLRGDGAAASTWKNGQGTHLPTNAGGTDPTIVDTPYRTKGVTFASGNSVYRDTTSTSYADMGTDDMIIEIILQTPVSPVSNQEFLSKYDGSTGWFLFVDTLTRVTFQLDDGTTAAALRTPTLTDGRWYHVMFFVEHGNNVRTYVNGLNTGSGSIAAIGSVTGGSTNLTAGGDAASTTADYDGTIALLNVHIGAGIVPALTADQDAIALSRFNLLP